MKSSALRSLITARKRAKNERERPQLRLIENREIHKASIEAKLSGLATGNQFENFIRCGREEIYRTCEDCRRVETFYYRCNRKWCPLCNYRIGQKRGLEIGLWANTISQPKHLVLTMRNFPILTRSRIRFFRRALLKLRHRKIFAAVKGGCASLEITNEGKGWHLHAHLLLDVRFIDIQKIAIQWGKLVGQEFGIVHIKDVRGQDFVREVAKYVAKGSELATWPAEQLLEFITAIQGCRFFFQFGSLRAAREAIKKTMRDLKPPSPKCECGCGEFFFETLVDALLNEVKQLERRK